MTNKNNQNKIQNNIPVKTSWYTGLLDLLSKIKKDKVAFIGLIILILFYVISLSADFVAPYSKAYGVRDLTYAPPTKVYIINQKGQLSWPYIYNSDRDFNPQTFKQEYKEDKSTKYYLKFFTTGEPYKILGLIPCNFKLLGVQKGGYLALLGTDINGRDNFSRLLYGGQVSLTIGFMALFIAFPIGLLYGGISGYYGGFTDSVMMRFAETLMSIPSFYLLITLSIILPDDLSSRERFAFITVILAFIGWAGFSRVVRGMVLSIKNYEFVEASQAMGASSIRTIVKHILPQTASYVIVAITLSIPGYILAESGLSFLGLGIQQPDASWGNMLKEAQDYTNVIVRPWLLTPGLLIFIAVLSFNLIGDAVRDILDPKSKMRHT
ncbi:MAG: ABC transporter permease [Vampirovibrionia bacterium]